MSGKLGRRPAVFTARSVATASLMTSHIEKLGTPPSCSVDRFSAVTSWGMMLNDQLGDCVCADTGHAVLFLSTVDGNPVVPTDDDVRQLYEHFGYDPSKTDTSGNNPTDQGVVEIDMCDYLVSTGFLGHKATATVNLNIADLDHLKWAVELFGSCRLGINLPASAMQQFDADQPWDVVADDGGIEGGHDVRIINYRDNVFDIVTWGKIVPMTSAFASRYLEEAHCELFADWIQANGSSPGGFSLSSLLSDLNSLNA